ncbi:two-component sensor histidine kinase [Kangiella profundi]|uniref:Sensor protein n=2 Tax=Kangiella TaxID=261963 RepID=A0A2K9AML6_9GAMM|nr:two-component sensor histidine kinase [Kangiella profundi]MBD3653949.1 heavy metal sensor histidine kinase [Kangiella sp.]GGF03482.1 two-component sensor histidine kinase [Kangiella profundi]
MKFSRIIHRPLSLTNRAMLFVAIAISFSMLIIGHLVQSAVERHFEEQDADELAVITQAVESALNKASAERLPPEDVLAKAVSGHHGVYFQVWDEHHQLIFGPPNLHPSKQTITYFAVEKIQADNLYRWSVDEKTFRGIVTQTQVGNHRYHIVAVIDMGFHLHFLDSFGRTLWLIMSLAGVITLLAAWFGVHQGHAPLRALSKVIQNVQADHLDVRLDTDTIPAELITLVDSFNRMISRLEESFDKLSHFSADIAHELRTPLTNLITQTQVGLSKSRSHDEYRELLYSSLEEQERLTKMVNDMLWLAQSENGLLRPDREKLELVQEVEATFEFLEALAEEKGIRFQVQGKPTAFVGDRAMLRRALSNLLSNALRFTSEGGMVQVNIWQASNAVYLRVKNPGPTIDSAHLPHLFDRFYRVDPSRQRQSEGAGLGLAIVKSIVEAHNGTISVSSAYGITSFTIIFQQVANDRHRVAGALS